MQGIAERSEKSESEEQDRKTTERKKTMQQKKLKVSFLLIVMAMQFLIYICRMIKGKGRQKRLLRPKARRGR